MLQSRRPLAFTDAAEVEIVRTLNDYVMLDSAPLPDESTSVIPSQGTVQTSPLALPNMHPLGIADLLAEATRPSMPSSCSVHTAAIAIGSNLGDRFTNIELALHLPEGPRQFLQTGGHDAQVVEPAKPRDASEASCGSQALARHGDVSLQ